MNCIQGGAALATLAAPSAHHIETAMPSPVRLRRPASGEKARVAPTIIQRNTANGRNLRAGTSCVTNGDTRPSMRAYRIASDVISTGSGLDLNLRLGVDRACDFYVGLLRWGAVEPLSRAPPPLSVR